MGIAIFLGVLVEYVYYLKSLIGKGKAALPFSCLAAVVLAVDVLLLSIFVRQVAWMPCVFLGLAFGIVFLPQRKVGPFSRGFKLNAALGLAVRIVILCVIGCEYHLTPRTGTELRIPVNSNGLMAINSSSLRFLNHHKSVSDQEWAMDIVGPRSLASHFKETSNSDFDIFGKEALAPCAGTIELSQDGVQDNRPGVMNRKDVFGNHVFLICEIDQQPVRIRLGHLKERSVRVKKGMKVFEGEVLGLVGNSGNSSMPHLHLDANVLEESKGTFHAIRAVPLFFVGRFYHTGDYLN